MAALPEDHPAAQFPEALKRHEVESDLRRAKERIADLEAENARLRAELERLDGRRREGRQLLRRLVKYAREGRAETKGSTRLSRLTNQVADYLERTSDPNDILRGLAADEAEKTEKPEPR